VTCAECGAEVRKAKVCRQCGAPMINLRVDETTPAVDAGAQDAAQGPKIGYLRRWRIVIAGVALIAAVIGVISATAAQPSGQQPSGQGLTVNQLRAGECVTDSILDVDPANPGPELVTTTSCTQPHLAEVLFSANVWPMSEAFPGTDNADNQGNAHCQAAFLAYDGIKAASSHFLIFSILPVRASAWNAGKRHVVCMAIDPNWNDFNYSIKGRHL